MNIGDIGRELEDIDLAYRRFADAVDGPCMEDYSSDEEAYATLRASATALYKATSVLLGRLNTVEAAPPSASAPATSLLRPAETVEIGSLPGNPLEQLRAQIGRVRAALLREDSQHAETLFRAASGLCIAAASVLKPPLPVQTFTDAELYDIDQALQTAHVRLPLRGKVMQTLGLSGMRGSA